MTITFSDKPSRYYKTSIIKHHPDLPSWKIPATRMMIPVKKASSVAMSLLPSMPYSCVIIAMMAVGPIVTARDEPKMQYTKQPTNELYKPYWKRRQRFVRNRVAGDFEGFDNKLQGCWC